MNPHGRLRVHAALGIEPEPASGLETTPGWFSRFWHIDSEQNELAHLKPLALAAGRATVGVQTHCHAGSKTVPRLNPPRRNVNAVLRSKSIRVRFPPAETEVWRMRGHVVVCQSPLLPHPA
eukprot:CAMPEP_0196748210 /NCGR_PEP_ID=MMETSP1091-20130531/72725_1 /TAXON_ID=302021 /ORGANISM="Rhodomonas sp., Strain CCMP768" /LENGTH=120 /DNA_ID=CAMNT_0042095485 /DNA_START=97 /DNA_END=456 /DNA_ORIENTATION=+